MFALLLITRMSRFSASSNPGWDPKKVEVVAHNHLDIFTSNHFVAYVLQKIYSYSLGYVELFTQPKDFIQMVS